MRKGNRGHKAACTWVELKQSAGSCYCCEILLKGIRGCLDHHEIDEFEVRYCDLDFAYPSFLERVEEASCIKRLLIHLEHEQTFEIEMFASDDDACPIPDSWDYVVVSARTAPRSDSEQALAVIKEWIAECADTHGVDIEDPAFCESPVSPKLPTRIVDVGSDNNSIRLVETRGKHYDYLCLSHCWGLEQIITTTKGTIEERKRNIPWEKLSKTFQDAVSMTRTLGFHYIWIDSLCIVQDDLFDWEREAAQMASVYSNGYLTLAGTRSANGKGGLFFETHDVEISGATPLDEPYSIFFRQRIDHHIEMTDNTTVDLHPLLTRAWVYQERMLSTRILHFGRFELYFECRSSIQCECGFIGYHEGDTGAEVSLVKVEHADALSSLIKWEADPNTRYFGARLWRTMVTAYTALSLTQPTDRLPALGGLARQMAVARRSDYLAGLWKDSLIDDLLWMIYPVPQLGTERPRPSPYVAPTWSWASAPSTADYLDIIIFSSFEEGSEHPREPYEHLAMIESCVVVPSATDDFGSIRDSQLTVTGLCVNGWLEYGTVQHLFRRVIADTPETETPTTYKAYYFCSSNGRWPIRPDYLFDCDGPDRLAPMDELQCVRMSHIHQGPWQYLMSLVLRRSPEKAGVFERIGILEIKSRTEDIDPVGELYRDVDLRTVTII